MAASEANATLAARGYTCGCFAASVPSARCAASGSNPSLSVVTHLLLILLALQGTPVNPVGGLSDVDNSYCLETGACRAPSTGFDRPAPGILFMALGLVGLGVVLWRADRLGRADRGAERAR